MRLTSEGLLLGLVDVDEAQQDERQDDHRKQKGESVAGVAIGIIDDAAGDQRPCEGRGLLFQSQSRDAKCS
jgi:hypothetical protein